MRHTLLLLLLMLMSFATTLSSRHREPEVVLTTTPATLSTPQPAEAGPLVPYDYGPQFTTATATAKRVYVSFDNTTNPATMATQDAREQERSPEVGQMALLLNAEPSTVQSPALTAEVRSWGLRSTNTANVLLSGRRRS